MFLSNKIYVCTYISDRIPRRAILGAMMFLACMFSYMIRTNLSITIVAMVNATSKSGTSGPACSAPIVTNSSNSTYKPTILPDVSIFLITHTTKYLAYSIARTAFILCIVWQIILYEKHMIYIVRYYQRFRYKQNHLFCFIVK